MALEVFWGSGSSPAWRVLLALELKKIPYVSRLIEFSKMEHKSPEILKLNFRGRIPVIKDGDVALYESLAILTYLDRKYPSPPIFGQTAEEAGNIMMVVSEITSYLEPKLSKVTRAIFFNQIAGKEVILQEAIVNIQKELEYYNRRLVKSHWLVGDRVTAADLFLMPAIQTLFRANSKELAKAVRLDFKDFQYQYPYLHLWVGRMEKLPGYEKTYPPHWRG